MHPRHGRKARRLGLYKACVTGLGLLGVGVGYDVGLGFPRDCPGHRTWLLWPLTHAAGNPACTSFAVKSSATRPSWQNTSA